MEVQSYLDRLGVKLVKTASAEVLQMLHERHLLAVPFENLDIFRGAEIVLDEERIVDKIVARGRGGFCYELNTAFAWLLRRLGYQVSSFAAEVAKKDGGFGIPFDHMTLGVDVEGPLSGRWLADVGFGDSFRSPIPLIVGRTEEQLGDVYRLGRDGQWWVLERRPAEASDFAPQYRFTLTARKLEEFAPGCRYHQTSPDSTFTREPICTRALPDGRITLHPDRLVTTRNRERVETPVRDGLEWIRILEKEFGIALG